MSSPQQSMAALDAGTLIAERYRLVERLGEGGMGAILRVRDDAGGAPVALKLLKLQHDAADDTRVALFQREYQTLKQLAHPRIIRVFDYGVSDAGPYYTMELLDGQDMREVAPVPPERACALLRDVASSLAIVHSRGLVYRDLSQRNVRCTADGRAKLLDFGALTPMGMPRQLVGTPSFLSPEAVFGQPLDQRSDLYSLGVLAYWLLTGGMPFHARTVHGLRDTWRTPPTPPSASVPAVPAALDALVMSLLSLTPTGRPQQAGEVIDRLTAIGQLAPEQDLGVMRAYLTTPELVGREPQVLRLRKALVRATRGRGSALLVRALPGSGSTRLLDVAIMEAKLLGARAARACANLNDPPFASVRAVIDQWCTGLPSEVGDGLRALLPEQTDKGTCHTAEVPSEGLGSGLDAGIHARVADALSRVARSRALLVALDDAHHIDADSLAVFALLARACLKGHKLVLVGSLPEDFDVGSSAPLRMLLSATRPMALPHWDLPQTESLLRSVFGDVANVPLLADRIHRVALGNPRATMQLAQHLVDLGTLRHEAGAWVLPSALDEVALPASLAEAQRSMLAKLGPEARRLAALLSLVSDLSRLTMVDLARLAPDALVHLDELVRRGVLVPQGAGFAFVHGEVSDALVCELSAAEQAALHLELVAMFRAADGHPLTIAYHLDRAGQTRACLLSAQPFIESQVYSHLQPDQVAVLEAIVNQPERYLLSACDRHRVRALLVQYAAVYDPGYGHYGEASFAQLRHDTGLVYWDDFPEVDPGARIGPCLQRAQAVFDATPESERGFAPLDAIRELAVLVRSLTSVYARTLAADQLVALAGWLSPFVELAPILDLLHKLTLTSTDRAVREKRVVHRYLEFVETLRAPVAGLEEVLRHRVRAICLYLAACDEAKQGKPVALERMREVDGVDTFAALAWHVRMLSHIYAGRTSEAADCRQRMELLVIQHAQANTLLAMSVLYEAWGYELCEDLEGLKGALVRVQQEARRYPGWRPWAMLYEADVERLRGNMAGALAGYEAALALTAPGRHQVWPHACERRASALRQLGRVEEAIALGRELIAYGEREDQEPVNLLRMYVGLSLSYAHAGERAAAEASLARALACVDEHAIGGVPRGIVHEAEARIAILHGDVDAFVRADEQCARDLVTGDNAALLAKYHRLASEAASAGITLAGRARARALREGHSALLDMHALSDAGEWAASMLSYLTQHYGAGAGCLFGVTEAGPALLVQRGDALPVTQMSELVVDYLDAELTDTEVVTMTAADAGAVTAGSNLWKGPDDAHYLPILLPAERQGESLITGVAVVRVGPERDIVPDYEVLRLLGQALLDRELATGLPTAR